MPCPGGGAMPPHALMARGRNHVDEDVMNNPRIVLAAALALCGAGVIRAQTPPLPPANPNPGIPPARAALDPYPIAPMPGPGYAPPSDMAYGPATVAIGDNPAPNNVPKYWATLAWAWTDVTPNPVTSPLVTTSANPADMGILGAPSTTAIIGAAHYGYGWFNGGIFTMGSWWNDERTFGSEGSTLWNEQRSNIQYVASDGSFGSTALYRPIFDPVAKAETVFPIAVPGVLAGDFLLYQKLNYINGDSNLIMNVYRDDNRSWTLMVGYRLAYLEEGMVMTQDSIGLVDGAINYLGTALPAGNMVTIVDKIETVNRYYLGQIGARWERSVGAFAFAATYKFGFGWADERTFFSGSTTLNPPGVPVPGGILVQTSQPYRNQYEQFVVAPDLTLNASVRLVRRLRATAEYHCTYISGSMRTGAAIDRTVELSQAPASASFTGVQGTFPAYHPNPVGFFSQTFSAGLTWQY